MVDTDKKTEILKAASLCFSKYGFEKTTLDDIGKMIGLNKASLYYYYKNKESIFNEVIFTEANEFLQAVCARVSKVESCREKITTFVTEGLRYIRSAINIHSLTIECFQNPSPNFTGLYGSIIEKEAEYLKKILDECVKSGGFVECDTQKVTRAIIDIREAIKNRPSNFINFRFNSEIDYSAIEEEVLYTINLILNGLEKKYLVT